ncbi:MAG: AEC family transporter [Chloroflexi bacterium AL-W]|nr:AEC family transporter [Chloroflexi bacterium AL-N1]NOK67394.1 AEC family transporter [Chloroflexi bacterium AL-N10]NOK75114.1 AEC family transporter [Chloroflexi bacterium AL-N5]NOK81901.1 AEC family transporter [Chloroflexi bacterium AL-W]NOK89747.1 AEC family transporter [Chloroflexi bacterium AL-N15]
MTDALLQVAALIAFGYGLKHYRFADDGFWRGLERLAYWVFLPALFCQVLIQATFSGAVVLQLANALVLAILILTVMLLFTKTILRIDGPAFTSVFQGSVRFNSYVALATIPALYGETGIVFVTLLIATGVPLVNVLCVLMLSRYGNMGKRSPMAIVQAVITNPLIMACVIGLLVNRLAIPVSSVVLDMVGILARAALPCGLLAVGAALVPGALSGHVRGVGVSVVARFVLLPLISVGTGILLQLPQEALGILILFQIQPTSTASYVLARQLGGDASLMATIITIQTLFAFGVIPITQWLVAM